MILVSVFVLITAIYFIKSKDLIVKQVSLFVLAYLMLVVFSQVLFDLDFSSKSGLLENGLDQVTFIICLFYFPFVLILGLDRHWDASQYRKKRRYSIEKELWIFPLILPFFVLSILYLYEKGFRLTGDFANHVGIRSTITDYMFVYYIVMLSLFPKSKFILLAGFLAVIFHFIAAERMRCFLYLVVLCIHIYGLEKKVVLSNVVLLIGFVVATLVGSLRVGGAVNDQYNITHFGSVTVSSFYVLDYSSILETFDRIKYFSGLLISSVIPSAIVPDEFNLRTDILNYYDLPGGVWLPVFYYVTGSVISVPLWSLLISMSYKRMSMVFMTSQRPEYYAMILTLIASTPRWFMYSPYQVIKMPLYAFIATFILRTIAEKKNVESS